MNTFITEYLSGKITMEDIESYIYDWHHNNDESNIWEYLGVSKESYFKYLEDPDYKFTLGDMLI